MYNEIVNCVVMKHYDPLISSDKLYTPDQTIQSAQERRDQTCVQSVSMPVDGLRSL